MADGTDSGADKDKGTLDKVLTTLDSAVSALDTSKKNTNKEKEKLLPKDFAWDESVFYISSTIILLSISGFITDFFEENGSAVTCFIPPSLGFSTDQVTYVNDYCQKSLPFTAKLPIGLFLQALILLAPHYFWKIVYGGEMESFFQQAGGLALRDTSTGKYSEENFEALRNLAKQFKGNKRMLLTYCLKLAIQLLAIIAAIIVNVYVFSDFGTRFACENSNAELEFKNVSCSYAKLEFINILKGIDYGLLSLAFLLLGWGILFCFIQRHPDLEHSKFGKFCFRLCMNSRYLIADNAHRLVNIIATRDVTRILDGENMNFLLLKLFSTNSGVGRTLKSIQVTDDVSDEFNVTLAEDTFRNQPEPVAEIVEKLSKKYPPAPSGSDHDNHVVSMPLINSNHSGHSTNRPDAKMALHECITLTCGDIMMNHKQQSSYHILDICCGYHKSVFDLTRIAEVKQVTSLMLDNHYKVLTEEEDYKYSKLLVLRAPSNLSALPDRHTKKLMERLNIDEKNKKVENPFSFIIVGPMDSHTRINTVLRILKLHEVIQDGCMLLVFQPDTVEVTFKDFHEYEPPSSVYVGGKKHGTWARFEYILRDEVMRSYSYDDGRTRIEINHEGKLIYFIFNAYQYTEAT